MVGLPCARNRVLWVLRSHVGKLAILGLQTLAMITKTYSATVQGVDAQLISIEVNIVRVAP